MESSENKQIDDIINQIATPSEISKKGESMRECIRVCVNRRIDSAVRRKHYLYRVAVAASVALLVGLTGFLSYQKGYQNQNARIVRMTNPFGIKSSVTLSDGTKVIMNAGTTISYPNVFVYEKREVEVNGEAYFEVVHDAGRPFVVKADNIQIQVLGTKFNVKAYGEESQIEVALEEGSVDVGTADSENKIRMSPNEQVVYDKPLQTFKRQRVDLNSCLSWKDGKFYFVSCPLENITRQLERNFNVRITIEDEDLKAVVYTGDFVRGENLDQILGIMSADRRIRFVKEGDYIRLYKE